MRSSIISTTADSISSGGTITGDLTISGDLTITGSSTYTYDEYIGGRLGVFESSPATLLEIKGNLDTALSDSTSVTSGTNNKDVASTSHGLAVGDSVRLLDTGGTAGTFSDYSIFTVATVDNVNAFTVDSNVDAAEDKGQAYRDPDLFGVRNGDDVSKLIIDSSGNVGIGTSAPLEKLEILGTAGASAGILISDPSATTYGAIFKFDDANNNIYIGSRSNGVDLNQITIKRDSVNVGIGTAAPTSPLTVQADAEEVFAIHRSTSTANSQPTTITFAALKTNAAYGASAYIKSEWNDNTHGSLDSNISFWTRDDNTIAERMTINESNVGIGSATPTHGKLEIVGATDAYQLVMSDVADADDTTKEVRMGMMHYKQAEEPVTLMYGISGSSTNAIYIGGGTGSGNHATSVSIATASTYNSTSTTTNMVIDNNSRISLSNNDLGANNTVFGKLAGDDLASGSYFNVFIGEEAGHTNKLGDGNIAIGFDSMDLSYIDDTQDALTVNNVFIGMDSGGGDWVTAASHSNIGIGSATLSGALDGATYNVAIGNSAMAGAAVAGDSNTGVGASTMYYNTSGHENVGVGHYSGFGNATGENNTYVGFSAGKGVANNNNSNNVGVGSSALLDVTTGSSNVAIGISAGENLTTLGETVFIGAYAGDAVTTTGSGQDGTVAIGANALGVLTSGAKNVALGYDAMGDMQTGTNNIALGYESMNALQGGDGSGGVAASANAGNHNIAIGTDAMGAVEGYRSTTEIDGNIAIGTNALLGGDLLNNNLDFVGNIAIGHNAISSTGNAQGMTGTIAIGQDALAALTSGAGNVAVGYSSGVGILTGANNTVIGYNAFTSADGSESNNTIIGFQAGNSLNNQSGANSNTIIGYDADASSAAGNNQIVIGQGAVGVANDTVTLGNASVTAVYAASDGDAVVYCGGINMSLNQPAAGAGSMSAELLDHYEEGAWTPDITVGTNKVNLTYGSTGGTYTKIGREVTLKFGLVLTSNGDSTGDAEIGGFPFTVFNHADARSAGYLTYIEVMIGLNSAVFLYGQNNTTKATFITAGGTDAYTATANLTHSNFSDTLTIRGTISYLT